jgi:hypothetical protein
MRKPLMTSNQNMGATNPVMSQILVAEAKRNQTFADWVGGKIDGLQVSADPKVRLASAAFSVSLSHHVAIAGLVIHQQLISACALLRPQIEAYLRGMWLAHLASESELQNVRNGGDPPGVIKITKLLEENDQFEQGSITRIAKSNWPAICDFTHTGIRALVSHLSPMDIGPNFQNDEIVELLQASNAWAHCSALGIAGLASNSQLAESILESAKAHANTRCA